MNNKLKKTLPIQSYRTQNNTPVPTNKKVPPTNFSTIQSKENNVEQIYYSLESHPANKFIFGSRPSHTQLEKFLSMLYNGLLYSVCQLKHPSQQSVKLKSVKLPELREESKSKFLLLDLDETLIHAVDSKENSDIVLQDKGWTVKFNIRPYCLDFLENVSKYYDIYVFTASTIDYAKPIVQYLNKQKKNIQGILAKDNCHETNHGFQIKDLRIITNRSLEDIVIVDNLVHSFGLQLDNGIPIFPFTNNKQDKELIGLQRLLIEVKNSKDVRQILNEKIGLKKCLEFSEQQFCKVPIITKVIKNPTKLSQIGIKSPSISRKVSPPSLKLNINQNRFKKI